MKPSSFKRILLGWQNRLRAIQPYFYDVKYWLLSFLFVVAILKTISHMAASKSPLHHAVDSKPWHYDQEGKIVNGRESR